MVMLTLANPPNTDLSGGFNVQQVAKKYGWTEPMLMMGYKNYYCAINLIGPRIFLAYIALFIYTLETPPGFGDSVKGALLSTFL